MHRPDTSFPKWLVIAEGELGVEEIVGIRHRGRILEYLKTALNLGNWGRSRDETAWCAAFCNWCLEEAGHDGTKHALARSFINWGDVVRGERLGAIAVLRYSRNRDASTGSMGGFHVGFLIKENKYSYRILGGNQRNRVSYRNFPKRYYKLVALRWPRPRTQQSL
jgi:uncharacterized protein (TIGR02594 family)